MLLADMACSAYRNHIRCNRYPYGDLLGWVYRGEAR